MYAVIRAGGKQYRVAPGDVIRIEKLAPADGAHDVQFNEVLAVSGAEGQIGRPQGEARVLGQVLGQFRGDKVLVFHYKRKKQYKKLAGHRQPFTAVRITEIAFDGQKFTAPALPVKAVKPPRAADEVAGAAAETAEATVAPARKAGAKSARAAAGGSPKSARSGGSRKSGGTTRKKK